MPSLEHEALLMRRFNIERVAGVDEVGRGCLAGPVVAAAVVLNREKIPKGIEDSKKLSAARRAALDEEIRSASSVSVASVDEKVIDRINILEASLEAMRRALMGLGSMAEGALIDGIHAPPSLPFPLLCVKGGDGVSLSIAAASIVAKVARDRMMEDFSKRYPAYGFEKHKGYGTAAHLEALARLGATPLHRMSFAPLRNL